MNASSLLPIKLVFVNILQSIYFKVFNIQLKSIAQAVVISYGFFGFNFSFERNSNIIEPILSSTWISVWFSDNQT